MANRKASKHDKLIEWLEGRAAVNEADLDGLRAALAPISDRYLRKLLRSSGVPLAPLVEGVRQDSLDELERTLVALDAEYARATAAGDRNRAAACRHAVIEAKDHARWAARKTTGEVKRTEKEEMALWMLTWLENPAVFGEWVRLRKKIHHQGAKLTKITKNPG